MEDKAINKLLVLPIITVYFEQKDIKCTTRYNNIAGRVLQNLLTFSFSVVLAIEEYNKIQENNNISLLM